MLTTSVYKKTHINKGFTLVELLVTLVIFGILVGAGVPALQSFLNNMASRTNADQLATAISFTRQTAVSRGISFTICANDGANECGGATDWSNGWVIFPSDGTEADAIKVMDISKNKSSAKSVGDYSAITFNARGENTGPEITLVMCNLKDEASTARVLRVTTSGSLNNTGILSGTTCN